MKDIGLFAEVAVIVIRRYVADPGSVAGAV
jgi:hypothetical protein